MKKYLAIIFLWSVGLSAFANEYTGCNDPRYKEYVDTRLAFYEKLDKQRYAELQETISNRSFSDLSISEQERYLYEATVLSAQFGSLDSATASIKAYEELPSPVWPIRETGDRKHKIYIAKGWASLREGKDQEAIKYLLEAANVETSPVLSSFGPDKTLTRQLYRLGYSAAILKYLERVESFWNTEDALEFISLWRKMIEHECPIQFQFYDKTSTEGFGF